MTAIAEQISATVADALAEITIDNGYPFTVSSVTRPPRLGDTTATADKSVVLIQRTRDQGDPEGMEGGDYKAWTQHYTVMLVRRVSDAASTAADSVNNECAACIEKALAIEPSAFTGISPGQVIEVAITSIEPIEPTDGSTVGVVVALEILYRHPRSEPFVSS